MASIQDFKVRKGLSVAENASVTGNTTIGGFANVAGTLQVTSTSAHTGAATFANTVGITGVTTISNTLTVSTTSVSTFGTGNVTFDTSTLTVDATNNRVGVNTALGQTVAFVVNGGANVIGTFVANTINFDSLSGNTLSVGSGANSSFKTNLLFVDTTNSRIGIKTATPDAELSVTGSANVSSAVKIGGTLNATLATALANTLSVGGLATLSAGLTVTGTANVSTNLNVSGLTALSGNTTTPRIGLSAGSTNGIWWPDNAYGGTGDSCGIYLTNVTGEQQKLTIAMTNDTDDIVYFSVPSSTNGVQINGNAVWHAGNDGASSGLDADVLDGMQPDSASNASTVVARDASKNFSANTITANLSGTASYATNGQYLLWNSAYRSADNAATANTIVARDASANFSANVITATATSARYADLAEYYLADEEYPVGTVMAVGGDKEVTAAQLTDGARPIGVVSQNPAYIMNDGLAGNGGTAVALKGRVPVRVTGAVRKGQALGASTTKGVAQGVSATDLHFAVALQSSNGDNQLVEAIIL